MQSQRNSYSRIQGQNSAKILEKQDQYSAKQRTKTAYDLNYLESDQSTISSINYDCPKQIQVPSNLAQKNQQIQKSILSATEPLKDAILQSFQDLEIPFQLIDNEEEHYDKCGMIIKRIKESEKKINHLQTEVKQLIKQPFIMIKQMEVLGKMKRDLLVQLESLTFGIQEIKSQKKLVNPHSYSYQLLEQVLTVISYIKKDMIGGQELSEKLISSYSKLLDLPNIIDLQLKETVSANVYEGSQDLEIIPTLQELDKQGKFEIEKLLNSEGTLQLKQEIICQSEQLRKVKQHLEVYSKQLSKYNNDEIIKILKPALWVLKTTLSIKEKSLYCLDQMATKMIEQSSKKHTQSQQINPSILIAAGNKIVDQTQDRCKQEILNLFQKKIDEIKTHQRTINNSHNSLKNFASLLIRDIVEDFQNRFKNEEQVKVQEILKLFPGSLNANHIYEFQELIEAVSDGDVLSQRKVSLLSQIQQILRSLETKQVTLENISQVNKQHQEDNKQIENLIKKL